MVSLAGEWKFQTGCEQDELAELSFEHTIQIPGIMQAQGYGEDISIETKWVSGLHDPLWYIRGEYQRGQEEGVNVPFLSQPPRHYLGVAWYQREIQIEKAGRYSLEIECTRWKTEAYMDGRYAGTEISLCTPHCFELGFLESGMHTLTMKIDNRMQYAYRPDGHGVSDALGATWNGMVGRIALRKIPEVCIKNVVIKPDAESLMLDVQIRLGKPGMGEKAAKISVKVEGRCYPLSENAGCNCVEKELEHLLRDEEDMVCVRIDCSGVSTLWDEYTRSLNRLCVKVSAEGEEAEKSLNFGFRRIEAGTDGFYVNGRPTYLRGTHFGGDFPLTGYPATETGEWEKRFSICREWGLNFVRFHSYCPPEAAFDAADRLGVYLLVECGMWNVFREGNGMDEVLRTETDRILTCFGHHPSFIMLSPSNEPGGKWMPVLSKWYQWCRKEEGHYSGQRIYTMQSGWPYPVAPAQIENTDFVYFHRSGFGELEGGTIRNSQGWAGKDYRASLEGIRYPVITHELGQWCSYPDFDIIDKFTGYMQPGNYRVFLENAKAADVLSQNKEFVRASGRTQVQMYKEDLEANFRTPHIYGFEMLDLHDYLGQGGAFVGLLDAFWDSKGYAEPEEFRHFCGETVLLLRLGKRLFTQGEALECTAELAHFGKEELGEKTIFWRVYNAKGSLIQSGCFEKKRYTWGKNQAIGNLAVRLEAECFAAPDSYTIELGIAGTDIVNSWNIWLYEEHINLPVLKEAVYTRDLTEAAEALEAGKKVLYCPYLQMLDWNCPYLSEKPTFWNAQMGPRWSRGLGILCDSSHPALKDFPTRDYQEYQWSELMRDAKGINLEYYPEGYTPIVQPIDEWNRNYKLGLVTEVKVGEGSLLLVSCELEKNQTPVKRQLLKSLLSYVDSEAFAPQAQMSRQDFLKSFADMQVVKRLRGSARLLEDLDAGVSEAFDGNPNTTFVYEGTAYPYTLELVWEEEQELTGFVYMPVQNQRNHDGDIREYELYCRIGGVWEKVVEGSFISSFEPKRIFFDRTIRADGMRLRAKSGFDGRAILSVAEFAPVTVQGALAAELTETEAIVTAKTATIEIEE